MAIACVLVTHLPVKVEELRDPALHGKASLVFHQAETKKLVLDRSPEARDTAVGMTLEEALARCPYAVIVEANGPVYREAWEGMLDALEARSPIVEDADLGVAYVDLHGLEPMYGNEPKLIKALLSAFPGTFRPRIGVADGKFAAYIAALQAEANNAFRASTDIRSFLAPLPVLRLPTSWEIKERLLGFGLETIGSVSKLPFDAMQAQFGREGARLWRLANGKDDSRLVPRQTKERYMAEVTLAAPTATLPTILIALEGLTTSAFGRLRGRFARVALLEGHVVRRTPWAKRMVFKQPAGDAPRAMRFFRDRLTDLALPGPLETMALTLTDITGESGRQESLFQEVRHQAEIEEAVRQLRTRFAGQSPIYHIREMEPWSRIPERRHALVPYEP